MLLYLYMYIYIYIYKYTYNVYTYASLSLSTCIHIYIYLLCIASPKLPVNRHRLNGYLAQRAPIGRGQMGSALMVSLQQICFLTEGLLAHSRYPAFILPKVPGHTYIICTRTSCDNVCTQIPGRAASMSLVDPSQPWF